EPSYNQNYDDNYYPHESLSFPCCDYCGGSHETFQCQPDNQNDDFSGSGQIQTLQYPDNKPPSPEISNEEIFQAKGDLMKSIQTFLKSFNCIPLEEKPQILFQIWEKKFAIQCSQPEDSNELFQKLLKDLKELAEYDQSTNTDRHIFLNDNEDHPVQNRDALDSKLLSINSINSQILDKKEQEVKNVEEQPAERRNLAPILSTKVPENSLSMGYEHLSITPETESDEVTDSNAKNLLPIPIPDPAIVSVEEENVVHREEEGVDLENISQVQDIVLLMEDIDEPDEHFNPRGEIFVSTNNEDVDYFPFMFVIRIFLPYLTLSEISPLLLSAESEDTIFDPGISD
nr:hypothetical protein [Tanacetum cinerariifolium]